MGLLPHKIVVYQYIIYVVSKKYIWLVGVNIVIVNSNITMIVNLKVEKIMNTDYVREMLD